MSSAEEATLKDGSVRRDLHQPDDQETAQYENHTDSGFTQTCRSKNLLHIIKKKQKTKQLRK